MEKKKNNCIKSFTKVYIIIVILILISMIILLFLKYRLDTYPDRKVDIIASEIINDFKKPSFKCFNRI
jgi:hypothetical protein